jgi:hypothetical protein
MPNEPSETRTNSLLKLTICIAAATLASGIIACKSEHKLTQAEASAIIHQHERDQMARELEQQAADKLTDPDSVRFRKLILYNERVPGVPIDVLEGNYALCGEINAKNRMGGYVGYREFVSITSIQGGTGRHVDGTSDVSFDQSEEFRPDKLFSVFRQQMCRGNAEPIDSPNLPAQGDQ